MEILKGIGNRLASAGREIGIAMTVLVLAAAFYFSRERFWETVSADAQKGSHSRLVMIDAGHGGNDPGKVGVDGVLEKDLNLLLAKKLKTLLEQQDLDVLLLREEDRGLYDEDASNKKAQDMKRRCARINEEQPACVISIHQNSYHEQSVSGAQVFYYKASSRSERLGKILEKELSRMLGEENSRTAKANTTYYLLKKTEVPTVIIECGFLSSWEDCAKLQDETYQEKLVWAIHMGVLKYINGG